MKKRWYINIRPRWHKRHFSFSHELVLFSARPIEIILQIDVSRQSMLPDFIYTKHCSQYLASVFSNDACHLFIVNENNLLKCWCKHRAQKSKFIQSRLKSIFRAHEQAHNIIYIARCAHIFLLYKIMQMPIRMVWFFFNVCICVCVCVYVRFSGCLLFFKHTFSVHSMELQISHTSSPEWTNVKGVHSVGLSASSCHSISHGVQLFLSFFFSLPPSWNSRRNSSCLLTMEQQQFMFLMNEKCELRRRFCCFCLFNSKNPKMDRISTGASNFEWNEWEE